MGVVDNFAKRRWEMELNVEPLMPIRTLHDRVKAWQEVTGKRIELFVGDLRNYELVWRAFGRFGPKPSSITASNPPLPTR